MKEKIVKSVFRVVFIFLVASASLLGYVDVNSQEISKELKNEKVDLITSLKASIPVVEEVKVQEEPSYDVVPETTEVVPEVVEVAPVVSQPVIYDPFSGCEGSIEVAGISRCLMKDQDGEHFYLNHNLNGDYDGIGVPYVDFRHNFEGRKTIIYSHSSMQGNGPFQALQNYHNNPGFYWNNRMITIHYQGEEYQYEIFSVYVSVADSEESEGLEYFHQNYYTSREWEETIQKYRNNSEYDTGVSVSGEDQILILQTCSMDPNYYAKYYRYNLLVMGRLV